MLPPSNGYLRYVFVDEALTWLQALTRCPELNPLWTGLATIRDESEWLIMVHAMDEVWGAPDGPPVGYYNGAWVGLSSPDPVRARGAPLPTAAFESPQLRRVGNGCNG